jgi:hypothetical protein
MTNDLFKFFLQEGKFGPFGKCIKMVFSSLRKSQLAFISPNCFKIITKTEIVYAL